MRALLLAAGVGSRLRPITERIPKCLVPIHGVPLLDYWFGLLFDQGVDRVRVNTHYLADQVVHHVASCRWRDRVELVHEPRLLGTAGTLLANADFCRGGSFLVAHADNLTRFDLAAFVRAHRARPPGVVATMMTFHTDTPQSCGIVELDRRGIVTALHEKVADPPGNLANGAVYLFEPDILDRIRAVGVPCPDLSRHLLPQLLGRMQAFHNDDYLRDIGTIDALRKAEREFPGG
ncbi:MAG: nucleotidyltransferase family protein [Zetaproteobacteria bacterium]|nr:MAG: nucleotidyltransferase family protein [Zetaproteobacteria bacterium]